MAYDDSISWSRAIERLNLEKRVCSTFIAKETDKNYCVCNNPSYKHCVSKVNEIWNWQDHCVTKKIEERKDYGVLPHSENPFLRCDIKTAPDQLCLVLFGLWNMAIPNLIMRMVGDASSTLNIKLEKELLQGISSAANASNAWIITNGYKEEAISVLIGEIVYKSQLKKGELNFSAIAVGKWGNIDDCRKLEESDPSYPTNCQRRRYTLEPNHTHYIFFDDGTYDSIDTGGFVSKLAQKISHGAERRIPLVDVLVGGNLHALKFIWNDLQEKASIVIIDQSGSLANILCKYLKATKNIGKVSSTEKQEPFGSDETVDRNENDIDILVLDYCAQFDAGKANDSSRMTLDKTLRPLSKWRHEIYSDLLKLYGAIRQEEYRSSGKRLPPSELLDWHEKKALAEYVLWFSACLTPPHRDQIHIFDFSPSNSLQNTIYHASIQARNNLSASANAYDMSADNQIRLALRWSLPNITGDQLLTSTMNWNDPRKIEQNQTLFLDALSQDLHVVVRNFLQLDIDLSDLFAPKTEFFIWEDEEKWSHENEYLRELYSEARLKNADQLYFLDKFMVRQKLDFEKESNLNTALRKLIGDLINPLYKQQSKTRLSQVSPALRETVTKKDVEHIHRDIFLWCVMTCRLATAKIILGQMNSRICSALVASKILKSLTDYALDNESKNRLCVEAGIFETYAIEFVRCSYSYEKQQACELLVRQVKLYGDVTCLQMAIIADNKKFLYEDACQALLTNIWFDKIDPIQDRTRLITNLLTMGIWELIISKCEKLSYQKRMTDEGKSTMEPPISRLAKHGIDYSDDYGINVSSFRQFLHFHNRSVVKYAYACFGYVLFLLFFSYYMLFAFDPKSDLTPDIHWTEILTVIIVTTMLFEELRQFYFEDSRFLRGKLRSYFDTKNRISNLFLVVPAYLLFYVGLILRFVLTDPTDFSAARIVLAYDLELWYIRAVLFIAIAPDLGPKLVMIRKMTNDLLLFVIIIVVFIFGYGITSRSMTAYGTFDFDGRQFFHNVVYPVYYFVLGSFDDERTQLDATPDASTSIATHVMFAFHMLFVNILLLNLLIALFSNTINDVQTQAHYIWAYDRCTLIHDYYFRPALFPPFTFLFSMIQLCQWCWKKYKNPHHASQCFKMIASISNLDDSWSKFERFSTNDYVRQLLDAQTSIITSTLTSDVTSELLPSDTNELKWLKTDIEHMKEELAYSRSDTSEQLSVMEFNVSSQMEQIDTRINTVMAQIESNVSPRMEHIDTHIITIMTQMQSFQHSINWIMKSLERVKMNRDPPMIPLEASTAAQESPGPSEPALPNQ